MKIEFSKSDIEQTASAWLVSDFVKQEIFRIRGAIPTFGAAEARDFGRYLWRALHDAPTHALPKMPYSIILELGITHDGINPSAEIEELSHRFGDGCVKWNCHRKFGPSVLFHAVEDALVRVPKVGRVDYIFHNASHFGYGKLYTDLLANAGLISELKNTAGRGDEIFPLGSDLLDPRNARMGTNPLSLGFPTKDERRGHFAFDGATTPISIGTLVRLKSKGGPLPSACGVTAKGELTDDSLTAVRLAHTDRIGYGLGLAIELLGACIGGGDPRLRCRRADGKPGGSSDWLLTVTHPEYLSCASGDPVARMRDCIETILGENGTARAPGSRRYESSRHAADTIVLDELSASCFAQMREQLNE